jgi:hypothetical protein
LTASLALNLAGQFDGGKISIKGAFPMGFIHSWSGSPIAALLTISGLVVTLRSVVLLVGFLVTVRKMTQMHRLTTFRTFATAMRGMRTLENAWPTSDSANMMEGPVAEKEVR